MDKLTCKHCRYYCEGCCRKKAPVCGGTSELTYTAFPEVDKDCWCGDLNEIAPDFNEKDF